MDGFLEELRRSSPIVVARAAGAAIILVVGIIALRYLVRPLRGVMLRSHLEPATASFLASTIRVLLLVVVALGVLQQLGVETASLLTVLAAAGLAIALSLQNTLANFSAGLLILSFRMFRAGDLIEVSGMRGRVTEISPFHTVLVTDDNQTLTVPNALLTTSGFRNLTALPERRVQWSLPLRPTDDLTAVKAGLHERLLADARIQRKPAPRSFVQEWTDDRRMLIVQAWTAAADHQQVQEDLLEALGTRLGELRRR